MTDPQRFLSAHKLSEMPEMSKYSEGTESFQDFAKRIADMLLEPEKFKKFYPLLEKLGFGSKKNQSTVKLVDQVKTYLKIINLLHSTQGGAFIFRAVLSALHGTKGTST